MKKLFTLLFITLMAFSGYAQFNWFAPSGTTTAVSDIHICDDTTYSIYMFNPTANAVTNGILDIQLPASIEYIAGSVVIEGASVAVTESNITNLNHPFFNIATIPANGGVMIFKYRVKALCGGAANSVQVPITLSYDNNLTSSPNAQGGGLTGININSPAINIVNATNQNFIGNVGDSYTQTLTVRNAGLGHLRLDRANGGNFARILLDSTSCLTISNPSIGTLSGDTLIIPLNNISASLTGDADQLWENNEDLLVSYTVTINCCNTLSRFVASQWGCDATVCNTGTLYPANVAITNSVPNISILAQQYTSWCGEGQYATRTFRFVNTGTGPATNLQFDIIAQYHTTGINATPVLKAINPNTITYKIGANGTGISIQPASTIANLGYTACKPVPTVKGAVDLSIPIIPAGDTVYVTFEEWMVDDDCQETILNCNRPYYGQAVIFNTTYSNQCGNVNYALQATSVEPGQNSTPQGAMTFVNPTDVSSGQVFNIHYELDQTYFAELGSSLLPKSRLGLYIKLPLGFTPCASNTYDLILPGALDTIKPLMAQVINDTLFLEYSGIYNLHGRSLDVCMTFNCVPGVTSPSNLSTGLFHRLDTVCNPTVKRLKMYCASNLITPHCGVCPDGGLTPVDFDMQRISFGLPDNDLNGLSDPAGSLDFSKIATKTAMNGDTIQIKSVSYVAPNQANPLLTWDHAYFYSDMNMLHNDIDMNHINTSVLVKRANGTLLPLCTVTPTKAGKKFGWDLTSCIGGILAPGDSVFITSNMVLSFPIANLDANGLYGDTWKLIPSNLIYSSIGANPNSPGPSGAASNTYSCDTWTDYLVIANIYVTQYFTNPVATVNGCNTLNIGYSGYYSVGPCCSNYGNERFFPYEYRAIGYYDTVIIRAPKGYTLLNNQINFQNVYTSSFAGVTSEYQLLNPQVLPQPDGSTIYRLYVGNLYENGTLHISNGGGYFYAQCSFVGSCAVTPATFENFIGNIWYKGASYNFTGGAGTVKDNSNNNNTAPYDNTGFVFNSSSYVPPLLTTVGGGTLNTNSDTVTNTFTLQNQSNLALSSNSWLYIQPVTPSGTVGSVKIAGNTIVPNAQGYYSIGNLPAAGSITYDVLFNTNSCDTQKYLLYTGYNCIAVPVIPFDPLTSTCGVPDTITIIHNPAGTDANLTVINNNGNTSNFCTPVEVEMTLNSTQLGDISNLTLDYILPFGFSYVPNSAVIQYPINTPYRTPSSPGAITLNQSIMNMDINNIDTTLGNGLTGSYDANLKTMKLKIQLMTQCGAASGDVLSAVFNSWSACGDVLPVIVKETSPIVFTEAAVPGYTTTPSVIADTIEGCSAATLYDLDVFIDINQITSPSQAGDSIYVTLPPGAAFNNYDMNAAGQANQPMTAFPSGPVDVGNGQMRYGWPMTGGLSSGTIHFRFQYTFDYTQYTSCNQLLKSFIVTTGGNSQVTCNGQTCNLFSINGRGDGLMNIKMPSLQGSIQTTNCTYFPASSSTVSNPLDILITNTGNADVAAGTVTRVDIYCDADSNGVINAGDNVLQQATTTSAIPAGGSTTIGGIVISYSDFTCLSKKVLVNISRVPAVGAEQCVCEQPATNFVCIATPLPVILTSFTGIPQEVSNRLEWSVSKELNFSHYELERSTGTQTNFKRIASIEGRNALVSTSYHYDDLKPSLHEYYRLKMVDLDGKFAYSETVYLNREHITSDNIYVYPNPVTNTLNLTYYGTVSEETLELNIVDMVGKLIMSKNVNVIKGINTLQLDTEDLASGNYILRIKRSERDMDEFIRFSK